MTGRYLTHDPLDIRGGINTYSYTKGNPINLVDNFGLLPNCFNGLDHEVVSYNYDTNEKLIRSQYFVVPLFWPGVDIDLENPENLLRMKPGISIELWLAVHRYYEVENSFYQHVTKTHTRYCTDKIKGECGKEKEISFHWKVSKITTTGGVVHVEHRSENVIVRKLIGF